MVWYISVVLWGDVSQVRFTWPQVLGYSSIAITAWIFVYYLVTRLLWRFMQGSTKITYPCNCELSNRIMSIVHGFICALAFFQVHSVTKSVIEVVPFYDIFLFITLGYELYDALCLIYLDRLYKEEEEKNVDMPNQQNNRIGIAIFIHHLFCILSCLLYLRVGRNGIGPMGSLAVAGMFFMEFSSLFMHIRWIFLTNNWATHYLFHVNTICLFITFIFTRILNWPYLFSLFAVEKSISWADAPFALPMTCRLGVLFLLIINVYWIGTLAFSAMKNREKNKPKPVTEN